MSNVNFRFKWIIVSVFYLLIVACSDVADDNISANDQSPLQKLVSLDVYKSPTCGCCGKWVEYMENNGFTAHTHDTENLASIKTQYGIDPQYRSCHTAVSTEGYVFEGHVPAKYIHQFFSEIPDDAIGLAVPAMPVGSPGMEMGDKFMPYQVLLIKEDGSSEVYADVQTLQQQH
ncbi:MAG: DUF411 domain-containing protein [Gammaproteobacteria bacterium]|nr:DUF411 domain-containing protein [Gammaproteobacteria bacterium]